MINAGGGLTIHYYFVLEGNQPGTKYFSGVILFHKNDEFVFGLESNDVRVTIEKIDPVGGFIEATYIGTFNDFGNNPQTFSLTGKIKAKRVEEPTQPTNK